MNYFIPIKHVAVQTNLLIKPELAKYLFLRGNMPTQIKDEWNSVYGDSAPSFTTAKFWAAELKRGRKSLGDDEHSGRPKTATTDENIAKVHQMVLDDRRIKMREMAEVMNKSNERVVTY